MERPLRRELVFIVLVALIVVVHLCHSILPYRSLPQPLDDMGSEWIGNSQEGLSRAYFRTELEVPFLPRSAWLSIADDDYEVYINGRPVGANAFSTNSSTAFQHHISDRPQGLNPRVAQTVPGPELRRPTNDEWRATQAYDISSFVAPGKNVFAIFTQSLRRPRFAIQGEVVGDARSLPIPNRAVDWRASPVGEISASGVPWFVSSYDDNGWSPAVPAGDVWERLFSIAPMGIWRSLMPTRALSRHEPGSVFAVQVDVPREGGGDSQPWIRVNSNWPFSLFADDTLVGSGGGSVRAAFESFDLGRYKSFGTRRLTIVARQTDPEDPVPRLIVDGRIGTQSLAADGPWRVLPDVPDVLHASASARPDVIPAFLPYSRQGLHLEQPLETRYLVTAGLLVIVVAAGLFLALGVARAAAGLAGVPAAYARQAALWALSVPAFGVLALEGLRNRFTQSDTILVFLDPANQFVWLSVGPVLLVAAIALLWRPAPEAGVPRTEGPAAGAWDFVTDWRVVLTLIVLLGLFLRLYNNGIDDYQADENVSWDAARGIMRSGIPEAVSGVLYTRSALYHYLLAGWLLVFGDNIESARAFGAVPGCGVIIVGFFLARNVTRRTDLALILAFMLAADPMHIQVSRVVRFYQQMEFFSLLTIYFFVRGFIGKDGKLYQHLCFFALQCGILSQEVFVLMIPGLCIATFMFYRPWDWKRDYTILIGLAIVLACSVLDVLIFSVLCLTPHVAVATSSGSIMEPHAINFLAFPMTFFIGSLKRNFVLSIIFLTGFFYWLHRKDKAILCLYTLVAWYVLAATVMLLQIAGRYVFGVYPAFFLIVIATVDSMIRSYGNVIFAGVGEAWAHARRRWLHMMAGIAMIALFFSLEMHRTWQSMYVNVNIGHSSAYKFIGEHRKPGDVILTVSPMAGAILLQGVDFYLMERLSFDEVYMTDKGIIDRWSGGQLVSNVDAVRETLSRYDRVWILQNEDEARKMSVDMLAFLAGSARNVFEFLGGELLLWERAAGRLITVPDHGADKNSF